MSLVNEELTYKCGCHAELRWRISLGWTADQSPVSENRVYPGLAANLRRLIKVDAKGTGELHLRLAMTNATIILSRKAPSRIVTIGDSKKKTYGSLNLDTEEYSGLQELGKLNELLTKADNDLFVVIMEYGQKTKFCSFCGRGLTDLESLEAGYGPKCAKRYGLPWTKISEDQSLHRQDLLTSAQPGEARPRSELYQDIIHKCACGAQIAWRITPEAGLIVIPAPHNMVYRDLTTKLSRLIQVSEVDHFRIRLVTMKKAEVVLSWHAPSRSVMVSDGGATNYGSLSLDDGVYSESSALEGMRELLTEADVSLVAAARRHGQETKVCSFCGLHLSDPHSVEAGYGPICAAHYGLPWGEALSLPQPPVEERAVAHAGEPSRPAPLVGQALALPVA